MLKQPTKWQRTANTTFALIVLISCLTTLSASAAFFMRFVSSKISATIPMAYTVVVIFFLRNWTPECFGHLTECEIYVTCKETLWQRWFLLFTSIGWHHQAFHKMFEHSLYNSTTSTKHKKNSIVLANLIVFISQLKSTWTIINLLNQSKWNEMKCVIFSWVLLKHPMCTVWLFSLN